jgi:hypothetical protein
MALCTPALVYLVISLFSIMFMTMLNYGNTNMYIVGNYKLAVTTLYIIIIVKILSVFFWTWILNLFCKAGASWLSWVLVVLPYVLMFGFMGSTMLGN